MEQVKKNLIEQTWFVLCMVPFWPLAVKYKHFMCLFCFYLILFIFSWQTNNRAAGSPFPHKGNNSTSEESFGSKKVRSSFGRGLLRLRGGGKKTSSSPSLGKTSTDHLVTFFKYFKCLFVFFSNMSWWHTHSNISAIACSVAAITHNNLQLWSVHSCASA